MSPQSSHLAEPGRFTFLQEGGGRGLETGSNLPKVMLLSSAHKPPHLVPHGR